MIWCGVDVCDWLNKLYGFFAFQLLYMTLAIDKINGCGLGNTTHREWLPRRLS